MWIEATIDPLRAKRMGQRIAQEQLLPKPGAVGWGMRWRACKWRQQPLYDFSQKVEHAANIAARC
ncbi:MAG: hypothetical protein CSA68_02615 [Rhodobacterales bacterium]|nr:MAG: hypothetical protein CSA68_02615 [Rhodobacterales bacterium]